MRISRLNHILKDDDQVEAEIAVRWLIAQLKVNLRPLWSPTADALAAVSERFGDVAWGLLFEQLQAVTLNQLSEASSPHWMVLDDDDYDKVSEAERSWRDPSAHKLRSNVVKRLHGNVTRRAIIKAQMVEERFDQGGYEIQLLNALTTCSSLAERHSRDLVPHFLSLAPPEAPTKLARHKLSAWLTLFSKFVNPKALRSTEELRTVYTLLLSHPDRQLQKLALACVLTYKTPPLVAHQDSLYALLDDTRWRDQLTQLDIAEIQSDERAEVVGTVVRVLYGVMLEKRGRSRGADRRAAVLSALVGCTSEELHTLVDLMLQPINKDREICFDGEYQTRSLAESVSDKQLVGFLTLLADVVKNLGTCLLDRWPILLATLLDIVAYAQKRIGSSVDVAQEEEEDDNDEKENDAHDDPGSSRAIRAARQAGIKRFAEFFRLPISFDFRPYLKEAFGAFISPRIEVLDVENTQAPSALLELFHTWSTQQESARYLVDYDERTLPKIYACLVATNVKPSVVSKVLDIIEHLLGFSESDEDFSNSVFKPHVELLLTNFATLMERTKATISMADHIGRRQITILSALAPYMADSNQAVLLLNLFTPVLRKPTKSVPEKVKVDMVNIVKNLLPLVTDLSDSASSVYTKTYSLLSFLFQTLRSRPARISLVACFRRLAEIDSSLKRLADLFADLNAYSTKRMEEPDFDKRIAAFALLNETMHPSLTAKEWLPVLYNVLNFIQDAEELSVRSNASNAMKRFIDRAESDGGEFEMTFTKTLYPGLKNGLRSKNDLVRAEILGVISYAVKKCERLTSLQEMRVLQASGDEEANIFNNIIHVQLHRRTRALRRLAEFSSEGTLRSSTLAEIFVPLVGNYIIDGTSTDHHLVTEAINCTGKMAGQLQWGAYYSLVQQYLRLSRNKDASERIYVRTLVALLDNFHFSMDIVVSNEDIQEPTSVDAEDAVEETENKPSGQQKKQAHIAEVVSSRLLPNLIHHLEKRDENEDSLRIPIAIGIVQVAMHLPPAARETQATRLLTILSQVFRSKSQDTRDLARETLCKIAIILGPSYLPLILRELRGALLRGPHLHILAFVVHALLVHVTSGDHAATFAQLDECVNDVAHVSAEVIFGESGKDVQSEDFKTKMREVRSSASRGLNSFAIIAKHVTPPKISSVLVPVRNILQQTETLKVMQQVEDLLRRIAGGLNANLYLTPKDLLVLCHTLISQNAKFLKQVPKAAPANKRAKGDAVTELKKHMVVEADHYANNSFRFVVFGLDLFITAFKRSRFDFQDQAVISRLEPMVAVIGNTLYSTHMQVVTSGLKAAAAIVRCPLKSISKSLPVFIRQTLQIVKQTGSTEAEVVQTAFKSLATILRDQPSASIKETDLVFLLELLSPDLEESSRQASVFTMLKAIVARKFVVPEIYDLMERVSEIMVTNQSPSVQEQCRSILLQFLLDYPQGKGRLRNQMTFLAKNLSYVHESGRKSVMELLSAVLSKFNPELVREYSDLLFVAFVLVVANDESTKCREMASELVKNLFSRLDELQRRAVMTHVHSWASRRAQPQLARVSSQIYGILIDHSQGEVAPYANSILEDLNINLESTCKLLEEEETEDDEAMDVDGEWQIPYQALNALAKLLRACPELTVQHNKVMWRNIVTLLLFPHAWVRTAACRLLGTLFSAVPAAAPRVDLDDKSPFSLLGMEETAKKLCLQLRSEHLDGPLGLQIVKNLFYIGKCFSMVEISSPPEAEQSDDEDDDDEEEEQGEKEEQDSEARPKNPLAWLFSKLSYQARSSHIARRNKSSSAENWSHQPMSVLRWFAAMVSFLDAPQVERFLTHMLSPIYRIAEDDTIRDPHMDELKTLAIELQELVQAKVGTTKFAEVYSRIRQSVLGVRRERKTARAVQAATNPAFASKRKMQRNVAKKDSRKRKSSSFAESRGKVKRRRDE
ncbi:hypothetical protein PHLGIDRAFT_170606 [Phlebiopsis gigantea 11061_1 CR5-6]|uniref:Uncharacterized protein n=1 Tax=Phlebiopsis gigantea (strain 11061_1 CR5-6) TaxID=745531 RepID=A0A0C3RUZ6_PHLG1|nr:hypothetical protein PHLGIDRAFT_170606 [Phlebiopsis gigantea 11061_1 CR5-6]